MGQTRKRSLNINSRGRYYRDSNRSLKRNLRDYILNRGRTRDYRSRSKRNRNRTRDYRSRSKRNLRNYIFNRSRTRDYRRRSKRNVNRDYLYHKRNSHARLAKHVRSNRDYVQFTIYDSKKHKINRDTIICKNYILYPSYCEYINSSSRNEDYRYYKFDDGTVKPYSNVYFYNKVSSK